MASSAGAGQSQVPYWVALALAGAVSVTGLVLGSALGWGLFFVGLLGITAVTLVLRRQRLRGTGVYRGRP